MALAFDLISDLHVETWPTDIDWQIMPTSPVCVVAGDVARDRDVLCDTLGRLGQSYQAVFYIDGNDEHKQYASDLDASYQDLADRIKQIPHVVYLQDNVVVIDGVAILGTNGWWGFDFDLGIDARACGEWYKDTYAVDNSVIKHIARMSSLDAQYMINSVRRLQTLPDVEHVVLVTHTVPSAELIRHDLRINCDLRFNVMGNRLMRHVLDADTERKIHTWCFGHYHGTVDRIIDGVRYVNHCRGRGDTDYGQHVYYPRRMVID